MGRLAIRLDDITADMNWENFIRVKEILDKYDVKPLIGVVPDNKDPKLSVGKKREDFWDYILMLQKEDWTIAQHGYQHVYETKNGGILGLHEFSEFAGLAYDVQFEKLRMGMEILRSHGIDAKVFMAPGHTYDEATLQALTQLKIPYVTDGYSEVPYIRNGLFFLPCTISTPKEPKKFDTLCLHVNNMSDEEIENLDVFLGEYEACVIDYLDIMHEDYFVPYKGRIRRQEKKKLKKRTQSIKNADNDVMQRFLQRTYDEVKWKKQLKRIMGIPRLIIEMIFCKR